MADDRKAVEGAIDYAILQAGAAPSSRIGAAGWIQGVGYDWLQGQINSGSSLGSRGSILNKLIQGGFGGSFIAPFNDLGNGEVDTSLLVGTGSATFTRATTATTVNSSGTIVSVGSGVPRSYYDPTSLAYLGYLAEGARTNLCLQSNAFTTTWVPTNLTPVQNVTSPDGSSNGWTFTESVDGGVTSHQCVQSITVANTTAHTFSLWLKKGIRTQVYLTMVCATTVAAGLFDVNAGTVGSVIGSATITNYPNGWYRCTITGTSDSTTASVRMFSKVGGVDYTGNGSIAFYGYGAQLEAGSFPSSYIPTTTGSVVRNADVLTYPQSGNVSTTQGSAYAEIFANWNSGGVNPQAIIKTGATGATGTRVLCSVVAAADTIQIFDGTNVNFKVVSNFSTAQRKVASSWGSAGLFITASGATAASTAFDGDLGGAGLSIGSSTDGGEQFFGCIKNVRLYSTQLSASQLQAVTS